ncbi:alpha/beta fold hydrolase [Subtercola frigoramans]|uniref:Pimeloyl-ACP methyl ester carboxylesterase n=1 Tax=Subtercola frigoramans TaxID=120298 RepID=A0ABS2L1A6_9MICO|nr:alpha/beta hydrolase [Subtercola frigoramans]MBM7470865.1 pimeloyl-ACP methyl ester carboxylesterase [Subtercola frigoramans]
MNRSPSVSAERADRGSERDTHSFVTSDGVELSYRDNDGPGIPLVMLPGLGQSQLAFHHQFDGLKDRRRVITLDFRGHGSSSTPPHGYRIARFAADVRDLVGHLELDRFDAFGWSMGASVWWSFIDLFGTSLLRRFVIVDQPSAIALLTWMSHDEKADAGALWDLSTIEQAVAGQRNSDSAAISADALAWTYTGELDDVVAETLVTGMRLSSADAVGRILFDHAVQDWRDVLPRIDVPTLVIGAEGSHVSSRSQASTASAIPGARLHVFPSEVASSHFPFLQNPNAFDAVLEDFLSED